VCTWFFGLDANVGSSLALPRPWGSFAIELTFLGAYFQSRGGDLLAPLWHFASKSRFRGRSTSSVSGRIPFVSLFTIIVRGYSQPPPQGGGISGLSTESRLVPNLSVIEMIGLPLCFESALWKQKLQHPAISELMVEVWFGGHFLSSPLVKCLYPQ